MSARIIPIAAAKVAPVDRSRWDGLKAYIAAQPWTGDLKQNVRNWLTDTQELAEYCDPVSGRLNGHATRDLGDITPYMWLIGEVALIDQLHMQAEAKAVDGLLAHGDIIRSFDNHDYVLSSYLLYRLTDQDVWRQRFLTSCHGLRRGFFSGAMPPAWIEADGRKSMRRAPTAYSLLELFCLAQTLDPAGNWTDFVAAQLPGIAEVLDKQPLPLIPRVAAERFGMIVYSPKPGRPWARLFKDNSNLVFALLTYLEVSGDEAAARLLCRIIATLDRTLFDVDAGWAFTEVWQRRGQSHPAEPRLVGNTIAIGLCHIVAQTPALANALNPDMAGAFIDEPLQEATQDGLVPMMPTLRLQHIDMTVDFVTAAILWLIDAGEPDEAEEVLSYGLAALRQHETSAGLTTLADANGPRGDICVKYNFLAVKLAICGYLLAHLDEMPDDDRQFIVDVFLLDR